MTVKEKMIEVFGEEAVKNLISQIKPVRIPNVATPSTASVAYVRLLEWLLDDYKEPVKGVVTAVNEEGKPIAGRYPWGDKKDTMTIYSEEYNKEIEVPTRWTVVEILDFYHSDKQFWVIKSGQAIRQDPDRYSYNEKTISTLQKMRYDFTAAVADLELQNDISVHMSQAKGGIVLEKEKK